MTSKKRVLILTSDTGFGHRSAATAIGLALEELHGSECAVDVVNGLDHGLTPAWLRDVQTDYDRIARELPELYKLGYEISDRSVATRIVENALRVILFRPMREIYKAFKPDAIVSTFPIYLAPLDAVFAIERTYVPLASVITDLTTLHQIWFDPEADLTIVPTEAARDLAIAAGVSASRVKIVGIPVHPRIAKEDRDKAAIRRELGWDEERATLLVVGSKRVAKMEEILDALNHSGLPLQLAIAAGGDDKRYDELRRVEWHLPVHIYNFVGNLPTMIRASDIVASKAGGLIVTEALAAGLPILILGLLPGQEEGNADFVVRGGAGEIATEPLKALEILCHWLLDSGRLLAERSAAARRLGRPRAAYEIAELAWELACKGPCRKESSQIPALPRILDLFQRFDVPWEGR